MTWEVYNTCLTPLIKRFGSFTRPEIDRGFFVWREATQDVFLAEIEIAISTNKRLDITKLRSKPRPYHAAFKELDERIMSDDCLDSMLKDNECASLLDLVFKKKNKKV